MAQHPLLFIIILLRLIDISHSTEIDTAGECGICDKAVFENRTATFSIRSKKKPRFKINDKDRYSLQADLQAAVHFKTCGQCHSLTFPAWPELDGATIEFLVNDTVRNATLYVQGVLGKPLNLELQRLNTTHGSVTWDQPPSRVDPPSVHYVININGNHITLNLTTYVFIWPVPLGGQIHVCVTAINPVGKGRTSFVNMSLQCDDLNGLRPKALPYYENGHVGILVEIPLNDSGVYCCLQDNSTTLTHQNSEESTAIIYLENGKVYLEVHNVSQHKHMSDTFRLCSGKFHLTYSTYKVQGVNISGKDEKMLRCYFINGATTKDCYVKIYVNEKFEASYSGLDRYLIATNKAGNYTTEVYDNKEQADQGIEPATKENFVVAQQDANDKTLCIIVTIVVAIIGLLVIGIVTELVVVLMCYCKQHTCKADNSEQVCTQPTTHSQISQVIPAMVVPKHDKGNGTMEAGIQYRATKCHPCLTSALHRHSEHETETTNHEMDAAHFGDVLSCPLGENENRAEGVVDGLQDTIVLDNPPQVQAAFDNKKTTTA